MATAYYLPASLPAPVPEPDGLDAPYWAGTRQSELRIQRCRGCRAWLWGPEWICHQCLSFDLEWQRVHADSESDGPIVHHIENRFMRPTDFSPLT